MPYLLIFMDDFLQIIEKKKKEIKKKLEEHAIGNNIRLNPDEKTVSEILDKLMIRKRKFGDFYCPCRMVTDNNEKNKEIVCPCIYHLDEIEKNRSCLCGLFVKS